MEQVENEIEIKNFKKDQKRIEIEIKNFKKDQTEYAKTIDFEDMNKIEKELIIFSNFQDLTERIITMVKQLKLLYKIKKKI